MADTISKERRSELMSRIRSKNSKVELAVRSLVHRMGYRFRLHRKNLPGKPDLVFPGRKKAIFVHGCFWHWHPDPDCKRARMPKSRQEFWKPKLEANRRRDRENKEKLSSLGWEVLEIWECEVGDLNKIMERISAFLDPATASD
ncbi:MAG: very short patch repair endonuclease [Gammaproteobacteria bacterium]|nr:very short patch repair endonuclease [Gammaproteobacteria bacterium]MCY3689062.1 very short patch repair endonuclease [Gammaproteobacteria bacterium]MDE0480187.1 very short patch repair endonuclease [Gammaproteobacteria bacterium]MDE0509883.1 very short patch repair endonuclease [Gammaproteobacteria bacterium]MXX06410.1 DNA mismatch endonuclease Vsr [Gammaproteobacteria bacterium]